MALPKQRKDESDADYAARLEKGKEQKREYYQANKEAILAQKREYHQANKEAKKEYDRKYREANREAIRERDRKWREANREAQKDYKRKYQRKYREAKSLASAKGKPLRANFARASRPKMLTELLIKVAEDFCRNYGFPLERKLDTDILKHAAETIRNSPELYGAANPWYGTDYLSPGIVNSKWARNFRYHWRNKV